MRVKTILKWMKRKIIFIVCLMLVLGGLFFFTLQNKTAQQQAAKPAEDSCPNLTITTPKQGTKITSPMTVTVIVDNTKSQSCHWTVFEAQAGTMTLTDSTGQTIGTGVLTTTSEWMTDKAVIYNGTINLTKIPASSYITLTVTEEDPSGKGGKQITLPLKY